MHQEVDRYANRSPLSGFDPRIKIVSFMVLVLSVVTITNLESTALVLVVASGLLFVSGLPLRFAAHFLKWPLMFISLFLFIMPFSVEGTPAFRVGGVVATFEGFKHGFLISSRALAAVILVFLVVATTRFDTLLKALEKLKLPNVLIQVLMFSYRYSFLFSQEFERMRLAAKTRGFKPVTNMRTLHVLGSMVGMLLVRSHERAEHVFWAMRAKGYDGKIRTFTELSLRQRDWIFACFIVVFAIFLHLVGG
ncbi:MAG: cobalt ECF transporter T component CbiQ [Methanobacteriota archaeon]|nr:MAG: cobalt ECF transporter T component CbiQ [Euryarchaeota archaeon]